MSKPPKYSILFRFFYKIFTHFSVRVTCSGHLVLPVFITLIIFVISSVLVRDDHLRNFFSNTLNLCSFIGVRK
jgi:hypothetical protein